MIFVKHVIQKKLYKTLKYWNAAVKMFCNNFFLTIPKKKIETNGTLCNIFY